MPSTAIDSQIHGCMFSTDEMRETLSDRAWAQKWLDTEAALAKAQAELGIIPQEKADLINEYAKAELLDIPSIGEFYKSSITIVPLRRFFRIAPVNSCTGAPRARILWTPVSSCCSATLTRLFCAT